MELMDFFKMDLTSLILNENRIKFGIYSEKDAKFLLPWSAIERTDAYYFRFVDIINNEFSFLNDYDDLVLVLPSDLRNKICDFRGFTDFFNEMKQVKQIYFFNRTSQHFSFACENLEHIYLYSLENFNAGSDFFNCKKLKTINVFHSESFKTIDGALYKEHPDIGLTLIKMPQANEKKTLTPGTKCLGTNSLFDTTLTGCQFGENFFVPNGITGLYDCFYWETTGSKTLYIPSSIEYIDEEIFNHRIYQKFCVSKNVYDFYRHQFDNCGAQIETLSSDNLLDNLLEGGLSMTEINEVIKTTDAYER